MNKKGYVSRKYPEYRKGKAIRRIMNRAKKRKLDKFYRDNCERVKGAHHNCKHFYYGNCVKLDGNKCLRPNPPSKSTSMFSGVLF